MLRAKRDVARDFARARRTCQQPALVRFSAIVQTGATLFSNRNNNELFIINLATVTDRRIFIIPPAKKHVVERNLFFCSTLNL